MKKIIYLLILLPLFLFSCEKIPLASFFIDNIETVVGGEVYFKNDSRNAERFEWDFGDGTGSTEPSPVHVYTGTGSYEVFLTAYSRTGQSDQTSQTIEIMTPTLLEVEVLEYFAKYPVENASIIIYPTLDDWDAESNMITEGFTDANGKAVFSGLGKFVYYIDVWEEHHNNFALRNEDVAFIRTDEIMPHEINRFIAYVDYIPGKNGDGKRDRKVMVKRLKIRTMGK